MIGYYVHHQGAGHLHRMVAISAHVGADVVGLSSLPAPEGHHGGWLQLERDDLDAAPRDVTAHGTLHWAPRHDPGLRWRMAQLVHWIDTERPDAVVVDVSAEVATAARLCGVPVVVAAMPGARLDDTHRLAYGLADALLAPWPDPVRPSWLEPWVAKTSFVGAISAFDHLAPPAPSHRHDREVLLLCGRGGAGVPVDLDAVRAATPGWTWRLAGGDAWLSREQVWEALCTADVVVTHAGQNAVAEVAAARARAVVVADPRPFDEQAHTCAALRRLELAVTRDRWPEPSQWLELLELARRTDPRRWRVWSHGDGASRAARVIERVAGQRSGQAVRT